MKKIDVEIIKNNEYIVINMLDNGRGFNDTKSILKPYYTTKKEDVWLPVIHKQQSLTQHDVDYLKQTGRFTFELMREEI